MSAWDLFWMLFVFLPLLIIWVIVLVDVMRRPDLVGWQKALWVMGVIFFPWLGGLAYLITQPSLMGRSGPEGSTTRAAVATVPTPSIHVPPPPISADTQARQP